MSRVEDPEENSVRASGAVLPSTSSHSQPEAKAREQAEGPARRSFVAEVVNELSALTSEPDRSNAPFGITGRMAASMGFLAIVALLFVILMPSLRQADAPSSFSEEVQQFTAALSRQPRPQPPSADAAKPAIAEFQSLLTPSSEPAAQSDRNQSDGLLRQFMQWRQKTNSGANAQ